MRYLAQYAEEKNRFRKLFKKPLFNTASLSPSDIRELSDILEGDLSPENLCCDGELRGAALREKTTFLKNVQNDILNYWVM